MKSIKKIFDVFKRIMPKGISFKKIYIFSYYGIDKAFKENSIPLFLIVISCITVAQFTSNIAFALAFRQGNKLTKRINVEVRERLFKKAMELDKEYHNNHATGATINTLVGDVEVIGEGFFWPRLWIIYHTVTIIV